MSLFAPGIENRVSTMAGGETMTSAVRPSRVAIVVDSASSLPANASGLPGLYVVPMTVTIGGRSFLDGRDLTPTSFYRMLRETDGPPATSAPPPARFLEAFVSASSDAEAALCLTVASRFSTSLNSARLAVEEARRTVPGFEIALLDSESAVGGQGLIALEALRAARNGGAGLGEVVSAARQVIDRVRVVAFLDTLYYLWKGGRVPMIAHAGTALLRIKPVFEMTRGEVRTVARPRTGRRAAARLLDLIREGAGDRSVHATVMHADAPDAAEELKCRVAAALPCGELYVSELTPGHGRSHRSRTSGCGLLD